MLIVEASVFTKRVVALLDDEQYRSLQRMLAESPESGRVIPGSGGLRKLRWGGMGHGRRGGLRVIYKWFPERDLVLMLFLFAKNERSDLSPKQLQALSRMAKEELS